MSVPRDSRAAVRGVVAHSHWICRPSLSAVSVRAMRREGASGRTVPASLPRSKALSNISTVPARCPAIQACAGWPASRTDTAVAV